MNDVVDSLKHKLKHCILCSQSFLQVPKLVHELLGNFLQLEFKENQQVYSYF